MTLQLETIMNVNFRITRLLDRHLSSSDCKITMNIAINPDNHTTAKNRIKAMKYWLENYVDDSVAFSTSTDVNTVMLEDISNNLIMCPEEPHDYLMLILIHSKMLAFAGEEIAIYKTTFTSDTGEGFENSVQGTTEDWLPSIKEWVGERHFHETAWWNRNDSSTIDLKPTEDDDLAIIPKLGISFLEMISDPIDQEDKQPSTVINEHPAEIIRPTFKPRIITSDD